ncbi:MAG: hypothetical protein GX640_08910 [Fibrobacter sp.]|nr:hypothetical protein [Fibrobacter sp.]
MQLLFLNVFAAIGGWLLWAYITLLIGTKILPEPQTEATYGEMIRAVGFASSPGLFRILGIIPLLGPVVFIAADMWMIVAMIVAIKQVMGYESWFRPIIVSVLGWIVQILFLLLLSFFVVH